MIYSKKDDIGDLEDLEDPQSKTKQVKLVEELGKQGFHYDMKELFEPIGKAVTDSTQKILEETEFKAKAIEALDKSNDHVKALELMNQNEKNSFKFD